jgi:LuxR family maltose regulon positive regulatory protein
MSITILLADDHALFRKGLRLLLEEEPDMSVVGEAGDGREAIERVRELSPDVVVMDISMPDLNGIEATQQILSDSPQTKVVALSIHAGKRYVRDMLSAGAAGYILKDSVPEEMINGIRKVMGNDVYLSSVITGVVVSELIEGGIKKRYFEAPYQWAADEAAAILRTKLHRPPVDSNHVQRPHLLERLDQHRRRPLTLVSAPAGYGKSFLISSWLESCDIPGAWVSLAESDNDLRTFTAYFIAAVDTIIAGACRNTQALLNAIELTPIAAIATSLLNELELIEQPFILVLDDYQHISDESVRELLSELLHHPPHAMHLVLIGRRDPALPISRLRAKGLVTEIRTQDLRFTVAETETFFNRALELQIDPAIAIALEKKTEGWVTGLRLAAIAMRHRGDIDPRLLKPQADALYVMEYLFNEVFCHLPPEVNLYLLGTAILDRFCGPLCEAVCVPGVDSLTCEFGGWNFITWLKRENLFLISLDNEGRWFRYHHLFRKLLVKQLKRHCSAEQIDALHAQASAWFAENGLIDEGLKHSLAAGDIATAMDLIARHGHQLMDDQQWPRLKRWMDMLPRDRVEQDPELLIFEAWMSHIRHDLSHMTYCLEKVEAMIATSPPDDQVKVAQIRGHFDALHSFLHCYMAADGKRALLQSKRGCEGIPRQHKRALAFARLFRAGAYQMVGNLDSGLSSLQKAMRDTASQDYSYHSLYLVYHCFLYWIDADLIALRRTAERSLMIPKAHQLPETISYGLYFLGVADYHQNELQIAEEKLITVIKDFYTYNTVNFAYSSFVLALIYQAQGQPDKAREINGALMDFAIDTNNTSIQNLAMASRAELALRQERLSVASQWLKGFRAKPFLPPYRSYMPQMTAVKILLAQDTTDSRRQAADLLNQLNTFFTSIHNNCFRIDALALQALLHDARGEDSAAVEKLSQALDLAEPGGFIRLFVDLGPRMADLLKQLQKQKVAVDYIGKLLAAFRNDEHQAMPDATDHQGSSPPLRSPSSRSTFHTFKSAGTSTAFQPLVEPLTHRELDVLELLVQRLSNKEIAERLFVSPETVKGHLKNIYQKLDVGKRREAVEKAMALEILTGR